MEPGTLIGPTSSCVQAEVGESDIWLLTELPGVEGQDLMAGVVRAVEGGLRTVEGVAVGDPMSRVIDIWASRPTRATTGSAPTPSSCCSSRAARPTP